ncbi:hypothetical protein DNTS_022261 [Danionella cerebrum]|uniref:Ig-like domain-containing protein n=1 Tax=Danionella cerebrum TaxID=2873325 RepID=A0A553QBI4_9TELE|nr:hypothetical protein DNTS_022261 [Danionella translucida]
MFRYLRLVFFCVFLEGASGDAAEEKSVTEGELITLNTGVTEILNNDMILWMFGPEETRIAEIVNQKVNIYDNNGTFKDRLQMDSKTGTLTIRDIRTDHSGVYKLIIINSNALHKKFNVTVFAPLPVPSVSSRSCSSSGGSPGFSCSLLCSVDVNSVTLSWFRGDSLLSSIRVSELNSSIPLHLKQEDLKNSYSCVASNPAGSQTKHLNIRKLCPPCSDAVRVFSERLIPSLVYAVLGIISVSLLICYVKSFEK